MLIDQDSITEISHRPHPQGTAHLMEKDDTYKSKDKLIQHILNTIGEVQTNF